MFILWHSSENSFVTNKEEVWSNRDMVLLTNVENTIDKLFKKRILQRIETTKISLLTMRKESFEKLILTMHIQGKRSIGKQ